MSERLRRLTPDALDHEQRGVYDAIVGGERSKAAQHFPLTAHDGTLNGPFGIMLHSPTVGAALAELGSALRFRTNLTPRCREIAILQVAHATGSEFEWWAHARIAKAVGITDEELMSLSVGAFVSDDAIEGAVAELSANLLTSSVVTDAEYEQVSSVLTAEQIVDVTVLVGYYRTLAQLMTVFDVGVPSGERPVAVDETHHHHHH